MLHNSRSNLHLTSFVLLFACAMLLLFRLQAGKVEAVGMQAQELSGPRAPFNSIVVNSLADNTTAGNGLCTLREAIQNAKTDSQTTGGDCAAGSGADTITFSVTGTIQLSSGLSPADNTTISGPGAASLTVRRNTGGSYSVFGVTTETVTISGMTINNGDGTFVGGGAVYNDSGTVTINNCTLSGNTSQSGGALFTIFGTMNINGCTLSGNTANAGGAVQNYKSTVTITNSTFTNNSTTAASGGHISTNGGTTTITGCALSGATSGGGILNTGVMTITGSTISNNNHANPGGGIQNTSNAFDSIGSLTIINSTIGPGNNSSSGGGAIANLQGGTINIINSTIAANTVSGGSSVGGISTTNSTTTLTNCTLANNGDAGILRSGTGTFTIRNTIVSGNGPTDIAGTINPASSFNLIGSTTSGGLVNGVNGNLVNVNPLLGALQNNGGPTLTYALGATSPAIDKGSNAFVTSPPFLAAPFTDQRGGGFARIAEGNADCSGDVDIGAYEVQNAVATPNVVDLQNGSDNGSSQTDNFTNDNTPSFDITGVTSGATVRLLRNCVVVASGTAAGTSIALTDPGAPVGTHSYTSSQIVGGVTSATSTALSVTIDTTIPTVGITAVTPDPRTTSVSSIQIVFSEAIAGFDLADLSLKRDAGSNLLTGSQTLTSLDNITWTLGNLDGVTTTAGAYTLTLTAAGSSITDTAGNALAAGSTDSWTVTPNTTYSEPASNCGVGNTPCFSSIQAAITAVNTGGQVNVIGGIFNEDLVLNKNVTVNINGNTTLNSLTLSAGVLNGSAVGSVTLTLASGNWTNNAAFVAGIGTVNLAGTGQAIGGAAPTPFYNLTIGSGGATLNTVHIPGGAVLVDASVNGVLTLNGNLTVTDPAKLIMPAGASSAGTGDVIGKVQRTGFVAGACATAPCPNTLSFGNPNNQITITAGTAPADIVVKLTKSAPATYAGAVQRNYDITQTGGSGFIATLRLHYLDPELNGNTPESNLTLRRFNGSSWAPVAPTTPVDTTNNWVESNAVSAFSPWTFAALAPTAASGVIAGRIVDNSGSPVAGAVVPLSGAQSRKTITDAGGAYRFDAVESAGFYTVTPARVNYNFNPFYRSFSQLGQHTNAGFDGAFQGDISNPIDTAEYFVRQQYLDVLGREPDEAGFNFWSNQILSCGEDAECVNSQRRAVAAAFFMHQEFQQSGLFIFNLYQQGLGRQPSFAEYQDDRPNVIGGPELETRQLDFARSFGQRADFSEQYRSHTTAESFVDALLMNAQTTVGERLLTERESLITRYQQGTNLIESRALVLRDLAQNQAVGEANQNAAFVLTEYFGYLRRNPDQRGFDFWLNLLNESSRTDLVSYQRMVCAFTTSAEYQQRFSRVVSHGNGECVR